jgi:hypothetical protein
MQISKVTYSFGKVFHPAKNPMQLTVGTTLCTREVKGRVFVSVCPSFQLGPVYRPIRSTGPVDVFFMLNKCEVYYKGTLLKTDRRMCVGE